MYLSYVGIRVTDLDRSLRFYKELFGLEEAGRGDNTKLGGGIYVLLKDPKSKAKLELNWYPESSAYASDYLPGEGLDHVSFRVESVADALKRLEAGGAGHVDLPESLRHIEGFNVGYVKDPDGNWIELYDLPRPIGESIPEAY